MLANLVILILFLLILLLFFPILLFFEGGHNTRTLITRFVTLGPDLRLCVAGR